MSLPESSGELLLLHNPKCSKSRATLALLEERGVDFAVRLYLEDPLSIDELRVVGKRLGLPAAGWVRTGESTFAETGLTKESDDEALLAAVVEHPILMQRPVLVAADRAAVGRPPEDVLALLQV